MPHPLLIAARISPYRRAASNAPVAVDIPGQDLLEGQLASFSLTVGHQRVDDATYETVGAPVGPIVSATVNGTTLEVQAGTNASGSPVAWSQGLVVTTEFGSSNFTMSGLVNPLAATTATIVGQWELSSAVESPTVGTNVATTTGGYFTLDSLVAGVPAGTGAMGCNLGPYVTIQHIAAYEATAGGFTIYAQVASLPAVGANRQILNKDVGPPNALAGGMTIEQRNVGGVSRLGGYFRNAALGAVWFDGASNGAAGVADIPINRGFMVTVSFDPTTDPKCRMYLQLAGALEGSPAGAVTQVATIAAASQTLTTLAGNTIDIRVAIYNSLVAALDGAVQRLIVWSGAPTLAQLQALPDPVTITIVPPGALAPVAADLSLTLASGANSTTINPTLAPSENALSATVTILSETVSNADVSVDSGTQVIRVSRPSGSTAAGSGSITYRLTNPDTQTDDGVITVTVQAAGTYTPFSFVTTSDPDNAHPTVDGTVGQRPNYSASDPQSADVIDPMSGIPIVRIGGNAGTTLFIKGSQSTSLAFPKRLRCENDPAMAKVWNADGTLLMIDRRFSESGDPSNSASSYLVDCGAPNGTHGANKRFQILRASSSQGLGVSGVGQYWVWDPNNPLRAFVFENNGTVKDWWPIGGDGHSQDERNTIRGSISNHTSFANFNRHALRLSADGRYIAVGCQRTSDGDWGGMRIDLQTGTAGPFVRHPYFDLAQNITNSWGSQGITASGNYICFNHTVSGPLRYTMCHWQTGAIVGESAADGLPDMSSHQDFVTVNGVEYCVDRSSSEGIVLWNFLAGSFRKLTNIPGGNPNHFGALNRLDTYENRGAAGGATTGHRYVLYARSGGSGGHPPGIMGLRMAPNDNTSTNTLRYICNGRSERTFNDDETHPQISPDGRLVVFPSNWRLTTYTGNNSDVHPYVAVIPDGWYSPNNNGS